MIKPKALKLVNISTSLWPMYTNIGFAFAHARREKNKVIQITEFDTCRETFANRIYDDVSEKEHKLNDRKLQCLVRIAVLVHDCGKTEKKFERQTKAGLNILNILEDHYSWPSTKMFSVEPLTIRSDGRPPRQNFSKLLVGSSKWRKSSHMASLFLLLFRLPTKSMKFCKVENYKQLIELCRQYSGLPEPGSKNIAKMVSGDKHNIARTMKFWGLLMTDLNKLFRGMTSKSIYDKAGYNRCHYSEGISKLCGFKCANPKINKRFAILAKNAGVTLPAKVKNKFGL
jgi:hypothetical protein